MIKYFDTKVDFFSSFLFILIVPALVSGPFLPDLILSFLALTFLFMTIKNRNLIYFYNKKITIFFFSFYFIILISSFLSENIFLSLESSLFYLRYYFFSVCIFYLLSKYPLVKKYFLIISLITLVFLSIDAVYQFFNEYSLFFSIPLYNENRASSMFFDELKLGNFIVRIIPIMFALLIVYYDSKIVNFLLIVLFTIAILVSGERTALGLLLIFIFFAIVINFNIKTLLVSLLTTIIILTCLFFTDNKIKNRMLLYTYDQIFVQGDTLSNFNIFSEQHTGHYKSASKMFLSNPIIGIGPKMFREECTKPIYKNIKYACTSHPHNTYIQLLAETGLTGFMMIFSLFVFISKVIIQKIFTSNKSKRDIIIYLLFLSGFINLWPIAPSFNFFNNWINVIFYLPVGFALYFLDKNYYNESINLTKNIN